MGVAAGELAAAETRHEDALAHAAACDAELAEERKVPQRDAERFSSLSRACENARETVLRAKAEVDRADSQLRAAEQNRDVLGSVAAGGKGEVDAARESLSTAMAARDAIASELTAAESDFAKVQAQTSKAESAFDADPTKRAEVLKAQDAERGANADLQRARRLLTPKLDAATNRVRDAERCLSAAESALARYSAALEVAQLTSDFRAREEAIGAKMVQARRQLVRAFVEHRSMLDEHAQHAERVRDACARAGIAAPLARCPSVESLDARAHQAAKDEFAAATRGAAQSEPSHYAIVTAITFAFGRWV
ncbi:MAG: hypothetical protein KIT84_24485 [Labilithrix sp.]|nr:hypothetical protein [Labilithrix sp.]MCW5814207.1 hypothetical protein [Labilithrix sp.]